MSHTASAVPVCGHCGSSSPHQGQCPKIRAIEYHDNGSVKRVEYFTSAELLGLPNIPMWPHEPGKIGGNQW